MWRHVHYHRWQYTTAVATDHPTAGDAVVTATVTALLHIEPFQKSVIEGNMRWSLHGSDFRLGSCDFQLGDLAMHFKAKLVLILTSHIIVSIKIRLIKFVFILMYISSLHTREREHFGTHSREREWESIRVRIQERERECIRVLYERERPTDRPCYMIILIFL